MAKTSLRYSVSMVKRRKMQPHQIDWALKVEARPLQAQESKQAQAAIVQLLANRLVSSMPRRLWLLAFTKEAEIRLETLQREMADLPIQTWLTMEVAVATNRNCGADSTLSISREITILSRCELPDSQSSIFTSICEPEISDVELKTNHSDDKQKRSLIFDKQLLGTAYFLQSYFLLKQ